jgi:hypothetical protein
VLVRELAVAAVAGAEQQNTAELISASGIPTVHNFSTPLKVGFDVREVTWEVCGRNG